MFQVGMSIAPNVRSYLPQVFKDFLRVYPQVSMMKLRSLLHFTVQLQTETSHISFLLHREKIGA